MDAIRASMQTEEIKYHTVVADADLSHALEISTYAHAIGVQLRDTSSGCIYRTTSLIIGCHLGQRWHISHQC